MPKSSNALAIRRTKAKKKKYHQALRIGVPFRITCTAGAASDYESIEIGDPCHVWVGGDVWRIVRRTRLFEGHGELFATR